MPDWQDTVLSTMKAQKTERKGKRGPAPYPSAFSRALTPLHFHVDHEFIALIDKAAQMRNINRSSYVRRAISAFVAADLGMDLKRVLWHCPAIGPFRKIQYRRGERDLGEDMEQWCPHPGCRGEHL